MCVCVCVCVCAVECSRSPSDSSPALSPRLGSSPRARTARSSSSQLLDVGWTSDRQASGSRSLGASPHASTSSDVDPTLSLPHTGQHALDQELDRALEISQLNLRGKQSDCSTFGVLALLMFSSKTEFYDAKMPSHYSDFGFH